MVKKGTKRKEKGKRKANAIKDSEKPKPKPQPKAKPPKEGACHFYNELGHWKRNCKLYLEDLKKKGDGASSSGIHVIKVNLSTSNSWVLDIKSGSHICTNV